MNRKVLLSLMTVVAAVLFAVVLLVGPAAAKSELPFKGTLQAVETPNVIGPWNYATGSGSGNATHLGMFTFSYNATVYLPTLTGSGSAAFVAANGDVLYTEFSGQGVMTAEPGVVSITEWHTITGGTGRFEGATGQFTVQRTVNRATGEVSGSFDGSITLDRGN